MFDYVDNVNAKSIVLHVKTQSLKKDLSKTFKNINKYGKHAISKLIFQFKISPLAGSQLFIFQVSMNLFVT